MIKARTVIGGHAFLFPDGAAYTLTAPGGTAGRAAKPAATDPAWIDAGVSDWKFAPNHKIDDFMAPCPGARVLYDKITKSKGLKVKGKLMEMSNLTYRLLLATSTLPTSPTAGGQYNPLEGDPVLRTWLQLQQYNQANVLINTLDVFVALTLPGEVDFGENFVDVDVEGDVLFSTLNSGVLT